MMRLADRLRTLGWFVRRPQHWGQAVELVRRKFQPNLDTPAHRARASEWCAARAVTSERALRMLGWEQPIVPFADVVGSGVWAAASRRAEESPIRMGGGGDLELLYYCAELCAAARVVETGVAYGWSSFALLQSLAHRDGKLASTDLPYFGHDSDAWVGTVVPSELRPLWTLVRRADRQGLPLALAAVGGALDLCHYDSDKSYQGRMWAYPILWDALRPGGIFISDDVHDNEGFRHFCERLGRDGVVVDFRGKYIGVLRKP